MREAQIETQRGADMSEAGAVGNVQVTGFKGHI